MPPARTWAYPTNNPKFKRIADYIRVGEIVVYADIIDWNIAKQFFLLWAFHYTDLIDIFLFANSKASLPEANKLR